MSNIEFSNDQWSKIYSFLLSDPNVYAGNESDCRLFVEAVLWMAISGAQWRLLPESYGKWNTVYKRFARREAKGIWKLMFDSTIVRALRRNPWGIFSLFRVKWKSLFPLECPARSL